MKNLKFLLIVLAFLIGGCGLFEDDFNNPINPPTDVGSVTNVTVTVGELGKVGLVDTVYFKTNSFYLASLGSTVDTLIKFVGNTYNYQTIVSEGRKYWVAAHDNVGKPYLNMTVGGVGLKDWVLDKVGWRAWFDVRLDGNVVQHTQTSTLNDTLTMAVIMYGMNSSTNTSVTGSHNFYIGSPMIWSPSNNYFRSNILVKPGHRLLIDLVAWPEQADSVRLGNKIINNHPTAGGNYIEYSIDQQGFVTIYDTTQGSGNWFDLTFNSTEIADTSTV
ncbi:MAG: hypothetical protein NUV82_01180, partial [Candidatus Komeilibacteria bacterium]|nr:hypothetical protein [Candidatus Komeilibacteria bacterium]